MKGCAGADRALDVNFAGVLLNDAVGDREAESGAAPVARSGSGLGGEEGIVDALQVLGRDAGAGVGDQSLDMAVDQRGDAQAAAAGHGFLGVEQQVEKDLLQLAGIAVDGRQIVGQVEIDIDLRGLELVFEQRERVADDLVEVGLAELGGGGAGEVEQAVGDFGGAEALLGDLVEHRAEARIAAQLLGEHLRVGGDDGQRGVDLVGDAGGEQADGAELVGLGELGFERDALGDVVDQNDAADGDEVAREQGRDGDVGGALFAGARGEAELVEMMDALLVAEAVERLDELGGEDGLRRAGRGLRRG